jgi:5-formyltetrahydrofolate cyclo-ligase
MTCKEKKKALRLSMLSARAGMDKNIKKNYDELICEHLAKIIAERSFKVIHAYIPMANEINISPLLKHLLGLNLTVVCPKTLPSRTLENRVLLSLENLEIGIKGTNHPADANVYEGPYDMIIVPGLAFDASKFRLGYGGGYYDNFLSSHPEAFKLGIFYAFQQVPEVPKEPHDVCLDDILCFY